MRRSIAAGLVLLLVLLLVVALDAPCVARAADQPLAGALLSVRNTGGHSDLMLVLRDPALVVPPQGAPDDPIAVGLRVTLFGANGEQASLDAPPGLGQPGWWRRPGRLVSDAYRNLGAPDGPSPIRFARLRAGSGIALRARDAALSLGGAQGSVGVRIEVGGTRFCALFAGDAIQRDQAGRFVARGAAQSALSTCADDGLFGRSCSGSPQCGGLCPDGGQCGGLPTSGCSCVAPHQACGDSAPACNGDCPPGEECSDVGGAPYPGCACLPAGSTGCGKVYPACGDGDCPVGTSCFATTFTCCGGLTISNCTCGAEPPPPPCGGTCPDGWQCLPVAPGAPETCVPPFCAGGAGAPACDGACSLPATECVLAGGACFCLEPCGGGDPYPICGGTCTQAGTVCRAVDAAGLCACLP